MPAASESVFFPMKANPHLAAFAALSKEPGVFCALSGRPLAGTAPEGVASGRERTLMGTRPFATLEISAERAEILWRSGRREALTNSGPPLRVLDKVIDRFSVPQRSSIPGCAVAISYDGAGACLPGKPLPPKHTKEAPLLVAAFYEAVLIEDPPTGTLSAVATGFSDPNEENPANIAQQRCVALETLIKDVAPSSEAPSPVTSRISSSLSRQEYLAAIRTAQRYIAAGDIYQVNLSQRLEARVPAEFSPASLWSALVATHPTGWSSYFDMQAAGVLLSNSPECFLRRRGDTAETFPIKGTLRAGADGVSPEEARCLLKHNEKELSEHRMIIDLERNDLGRLASIGSVHVPAREYVESYGTVHHLVSCVRARIPETTGTITLLEALFPGGSITGAPKKRAAEIIAELEPVARGFYTGAFGTLAADGPADFSILIRTAHYKDGLLSYSAGGGIVADSVPESEVEESWLKALAFLRALGLESALPAPLETNHVRAAAK